MIQNLNKKQTTKKEVHMVKLTLETKKKKILSKLKLVKQDLSTNIYFVDLVENYYPKLKN